MSDYNGWKNKETWLVNLWLGDQLSYEQEEGAIIDAEYIKNLVLECASENGPDHGWCETIEAHAGLITDLTNCAIYEIDFEEIAEHYKTEAA